MAFEVRYRPSCSKVVRPVHLCFMKFVQSSPCHRPTERLDIIFGLQTPGSQAPFAKLDTLYNFIFASVDNIEAVLDVFMFLLLLKSGPEFLKDRISVVEAFWGYQPGDLQIILAGMHSVIFVPSSSQDNLRIYHASLGDFLCDKSRSGRFFIDPPEAHARMAKRSVEYVSTIFERMPVDSDSINGACLIIRHFYSCIDPQILENEMYAFKYPASALCPNARMHIRPRNFFKS